MAATPLSAVLTGDLVASRKASRAQAERAMAALSEAARDFGTSRKMDLRFTRFRGDGWQVYLSDPTYALDAALYLITRLRGEATEVETRLSAGIGPVVTTGTNDLSDADGDAFYISGDHLEIIGKRQRMVVAGKGIGPFQAAVFELVDHISAGWSPAQAEAVAMAMTERYATQDDIAEVLGITRQAVQSRLAAAGYAFLHDALHAFRTYDFGEAAS
ncbi:hypothetical protein [Psychromarinibacter sp. S121]|uniref:hypothetical protein n=1 Tax=Psychromarinibacter sp. S121 TaxID=3415127 RepID=UPI003C7DE70A